MSEPTVTSKTVLRGCANHRATELSPCEPWFFEARVPAHLAGDKIAYGKWCQEKTTQHLFYTASAGVNEAIRPSSTNPISKLHGFVADFDSEITAAMIATVPRNCPADTMPNWSARTFSDGARLVWLFEEPLAIENPALRKEFLKIAMKELRLKKVLPGLDEGAWLDPCRLFDVGRDWQQFTATPLPLTKVYAMLEEASHKTKWVKEGPAIPVEAVLSEIERRYPGVWPGEFQVGARGPAFWAGGTNESACIVAESGMVCFSLDKVFYTWGEILGAGFVKKYQEDRIGGATAGTWYDGKGHYWRKDARGVFVPSGREDFVTKLKVQYGLHRSPSRGEAYSEVDQALHFIQEHRRVDGAIPRLYCEDEIIHANGKRFVNSTAVKLTPPADTEQVYGENFPWLANFFDNCWDPEPVACALTGEPAASARDIFFSWFRRFYCSALSGRLLKGQSLFIVGPVGSGKTLLSLRIIGGAMGGSSEASDFLASKTAFNRELIENPVWNIDDGTMACEGGHEKFSETLKRVVANPFFSYQPKHVDQQRAEWLGRIVVTLNNDASSVRMIPNLDQSLEDKIQVLKFADTPIDFGSDVEATITRELPYFLRWICDYQIPTHIVGQNRFGIKAFIHEATRTAALHSGDTGDILEAVSIWVKRSGSALREKHGNEWRGTVAEWLTEVSDDQALRPLVSKYSTRMIGRRFAQASRIRDSGITRVESKAKLSGHRYLIALAESPAEHKVIKFTPAAPIEAAA
jgi:hypothetical protein